MRATEGKVDDVEALAPRAPRELVAILRRCLAADPARRYPTAAALAADVEAFQRGAVVSAYAYTPRERALRFVRKNRNVLAAAALCAVAIAGIGAAAWWNVLAERDRAQAAEAVARRELGQSLARAALERYDAWDDAEALTLAALSLTEAEDPRARGVLVAAGSGWLPRLVWEAEPDLGCFNATFGPQGDLACRGPLVAHWWWGWPDGPRGQSPSPYPDNNPVMLSFSGDGQRLAVAEMQGTRFFARGETGPGELVPWVWAALPAPGPDFYAYAGDESGAVWLSRVAPEGPGRLADLKDVGVALWPAPGGVDAVYRDCTRERWTGGSGAEPLPAIPCRARTRGEGGWWSGGSWLGSDPIVRRYGAGGEEEASFIGPGGDVSRIDATPPGDRLYVGTADGRHRVYDGEGAPIGSLPAVSERTTMAAWHPDGARIVVAGEGGSPRVFEVPAGLGPNRRGRHEGAAYDVWFEGDAVITSGEDGALRRWSRTDANAVEIVPINTDGVPLGFLARSADALLLSDDAGRVHRLDPKTLQPIAPANPLCQQEAILGWVQESPDRRKFAFGCHDGRVVVTDGLGELLGATETIVADHPTDGLGWAPDGSLLYTMGRMRDEVVVFDGATLGRRATWSTGPCAEGRSLVVLADGTVVIGGMGGLCRFDAQGVAERFTDAGEVVRLGLDGASGLLAVGGTGVTRLFDTSDWTLRAVLPQRGRQPLRLRFEGDVLAVSAFDGEVWWYDLAWLDRDPREALAEAESRFGVRVAGGEVVQADPR
jgi:WD40 repeat protein